MAPSAPRTRAAAALRMKQIALDNQDRTIRRLRAQLAIERRGLAATKKELKETQVALEASHKVIAGLTEIGLRMSKNIALDNQDRTIRRLRAQLAIERRGLAATKKELKETQVALEASHKVIAGLTEIGLRMSKNIEKMKVKKHLVRSNHVECHQKFQARIHEVEDSMQAQHLLIEALVDEKPSTVSKKPTMPLPHSMMIGKKNRKKNRKRKRLRIFL
ncbi:hypothetical protein F511_04971 [Dorcoceras hygrometricum]|uniref:Uncharacterized protein n=1 Tax=Dorcoceras hygrometricum TaxID=472368 RepID=A0A2Z7D5G8_9LAMI|nr:hypothetical protein F511_04971 [Dorcoceras hygrometricum]